MMTSTIRVGRTRVSGAGVVSFLGARQERASALTLLDPR